MPMLKMQPPGAKPIAKAVAVPVLKPLLRVALPIAGSTVVTGIEAYRIAKKLDDALRANRRR